MMGPELSNYQAREFARLMMEEIDRDLMANWSINSVPTSASWRDPRIIEGTCRVIDDEPTQTSPRQLNEAVRLNGI